MARFIVTNFNWVGVFIGGQPFLPPDMMEPLSVPVSVPQVTVKAHVDVVYDQQMASYDILRLRANYSFPLEPTAVDFAPTDGEIELSLQSSLALDDPGWYFGVDLLAAEGQTYETLLSQHLVCWHPEHVGCPSPPGAPGGGCPAGGPVSFGAPDAGGVSTFSYSFANPSDPHGIGSGLVLSTSDSGWGFTALPDDVSVEKIGMTAEATPREVWHATVPAADGSSRLYVNDSDSGEFVPAGPYGTRFSSTSSGFVETIGSSEVHYDNSGVIQQVVTGESVHTYTRGQDWVEIEANTALPTKHRYNLQNDDVVSIQTYAQLPGSGWTESRLLEVGRSSGQIASLTSYPGGRTTSFSYNTDGSLASYQDCSGRTTTLHYEEA
jgi:hypothetical protein